MMSWRRGSRASLNRQLRTKALAQGGIIYPRRESDVPDPYAVRLEQGYVLGFFAPRLIAGYNGAQLRYLLPPNGALLHGGDEIPGLYPALSEVIHHNQIRSGECPSIDLAVRSLVRTGGVEVHARLQPITEQHRLSRLGHGDDNVCALHGAPRVRHRLYRH